MCLKFSNSCALKNEKESQIENCKKSAKKYYEQKRIFKEYLKTVRNVNEKKMKKSRGLQFSKNCSEKFILLKILRRKCQIWINHIIVKHTKSFQDQLFH